MFQIKSSVFIKIIDNKKLAKPVKSIAVFNRIERFFNKTE
jgi:hypothetical protein